MKSLRSAFTGTHVCPGTQQNFSVAVNLTEHYNLLRNRFVNCTYVDGNLELTWLGNNSLDMGFLQHIKEVTGYILIAHVDLQKVVLPQLQIIRGRTLFKFSDSDEEFAIAVVSSKMSSLELPALRDILKGSTAFLNSSNLCQVGTINWEELISDPNGHLKSDPLLPQKVCPACHKNCAAGCWAEGEENCQMFSKQICSPQCKGRCFGTKPRECCHETCAGGCTGPTPRHCIACKDFYNDGECVQNCPPLQIYNPVTYSWESNPKGKYAFGTTCVKNCPDYMLKSEGGCVKACPPNTQAVNGECKSCIGTCPKTCKGDVQVNSGNIDRFKGCTIIEGSIYILQSSFDDYQYIFSNNTLGERYPAMHPDRLEAFSTVKEITGFLEVEGYHPDFKNLSYFRNLEVIRGRTIFDYSSSLYIIKTSLESLDLRSLKSIDFGTVVLLENKNLCFSESIKWEKIARSSEHPNLIRDNGDANNCTARGLICDAQCSKEGCWGLGPHQCLSCSHFQLDTMCLQNCSIIPGVYQASDKICKHCNKECNGSCSEAGPQNCESCKHFKDGPFCVLKCPPNKYTEKGECKPCHPNCNGSCSGSRDTVGAEGCNSCEKALVDEHSVVIKCMDKNDPCPNGYFYEKTEGPEIMKLSTGTTKTHCRKCHPQCKMCISYGFHEAVCQECMNYKKEDSCVGECPVDYYVQTSERYKECLPCHSECMGCTGPGSNNCKKCLKYKVYANETRTLGSAFRCVSDCPTTAPHKHFTTDEVYCSSEATYVRPNNTYPTHEV